MSYEYNRRGRNWFSAMGVLFSVMAGIVLVRQLFLWGPEFVEEFYKKVSGDDVDVDEDDTDSSLSRASAQGSDVSGAGYAVE